jgi:hypothetical protein
VLIKLFNQSRCLRTCCGQKWVDEDDESVGNVLWQLFVKQHGLLLGVCLVSLDENLADGHSRLHLADGLEKNVAWSGKEGKCVVKHFITIVYLKRLLT